ncbi:hypothetical protein HBN50_04030 [Halobacteriovorax sp. GB3]|uniref:hypothetical protein n=1 Tax=Halobacteriovorax sp. GB3 TaxID=2719615 RepID=UPI00235E753E|nr:hypothetical protein [Halobacteriovorax sp. GB3]MDD0852249.1 hypothetical protein [Halobacteriovorax sp. GB3]
MLQKHGKLISGIFFVLGGLGLLFINIAPRLKAPADPEQLLNNAVVSSDLASLTRPQEMQFYGAFFRLAQKRNQQAAKWMLSHYSSLKSTPRYHALEFMGHYYDQQEFKDLFLNLWKASSSSDDEMEKIALLKSLGKIVSSWNEMQLDKIETSEKMSELLKVHFYASLFKSAFESKRKKRSIKELLSLSSGRYSELVLTYLGRFLPNHPDVLDKMQESIYVSKDASYLEMALIHLSKYRKEWMALQGERIIQSKNKNLVSSYVKTSFVSCSKTMKEEFEMVLSMYPELASSVLEVLFSLPRKKAYEFFMANEAAFKNIMNVEKAKNALSKGEVYSSCKNF